MIKQLEATSILKEIPEKQADEAAIKNLAVSKAYWDEKVENEEYVDKEYIDAEFSRVDENYKQGDIDILKKIKDASQLLTLVFEDDSEFKIKVGK